MTAADLISVMLVFSSGKCEEHARILAPVLADAAELFEVPPIELAAIAWHESRYDMFAIGKAGERGALQVAASSAALWCRHYKGFASGARVMCGAHLFALARARCPAHPFTAYHTPSHCGKSRYESKIRNTLKKATK